MAKRSINPSRDAKIFDRLHTEIDALLRARTRALGVSVFDAYTTYGSYAGHPQVAINVWHMELIRPDVVAALREMVARHAGWELVVTVGSSEGPGLWPPIGLTIRGHEIVDDLKRSYLPEAYRGITYEGARPGGAG